MMMMKKKKEEENWVERKTRTVKGARKNEIWPLHIGREKKSSSLFSRHLLHHEYKNNQERCSWLFFSIKGLRTILTPTCFLSKSQIIDKKTVGLELIKPVKPEECGIYISRGNPKSLSLKLYRIDICYMVILILCECYDYINCLYD